MSLQLPPLPAQAQPLVDDENRFSQDQYQPVTGRQRMIIIGLAITAAVATTWLILDPPGGVVRPPRPTADSAAATVPLLPVEVLKQMQPVLVVPQGEAPPASAAQAAKSERAGSPAAAASTPR
jgi:hypothetical protein